MRLPGTAVQYTTVITKLALRGESASLRPTWIGKRGVNRETAITKTLQTTLSLNYSLIFRLGRSLSLTRLPAPSFTVVSEKNRSTTAGVSNVGHL